MSASRLHSIGLVYEVATCFVMALATFWQFYLDNRTLPNLTWVPAVVILFPLILPGPPRRMLAAAILAGAMPLLALLLLEVTGNVDANPGYYVDLVVGSAFAVVFAYMCPGGLPVGKGGRSPGQGDGPKTGLASGGPSTIRLGLELDK